MTYTDPKVGRIEQQIMAINDLGQAVGGGYYGGAFLYANGVKTPLGGIPGSSMNNTIAKDINNAGVIIGNTTGNPSDAFVFVNGTMNALSQVTDGLNGWVIDKAYAVTEDGWILAESWDNQMNGEKNQVWLKPLENTDSTNSGNSAAPSQPSTPVTVVDTTAGGFWTTSTDTASLNDSTPSATTVTTFTPAPAPVPEPATCLIWAGLAVILYLKASR